MSRLIPDSIARSIGKIVAESAPQMPDRFGLHRQQQQIDESVKKTGDVSSDTHKLVQSTIRKSGGVFQGTISNVDHHDDGSSTLHIRHTKPQTDTVVKALRGWREAQGHESKHPAGEALNTSTSAPGTPTIHTKTSPLSGGWYHTQVHFKPATLKEEEDLDEAKNDPTIGPNGRKAPAGMTWAEYMHHEFGREKAPKLEKGARVHVMGKKGTIHDLYSKKISTGATKQFMHVKHDDGKEDHYRVDTTNHRVLKEDHERLSDGVDESFDVKHGAFHRWLGKKEDEPITQADIEKGLKAGGHAAKMAEFAKNAKHWVHEDSEPADTEEEDLPSGLDEESNHFDTEDAAKKARDSLVKKHNDNNYSVQPKKNGFKVAHAYYGDKKVGNHLKNLSEESTEDGDLIEEFNTHDQANNRKEYLDKKHPRTMHEVVQGRRSGKYFVVRKSQHGSHVAESVSVPDLESGGATQTMKTYDDPTKAIDETAKARRVNKIKSIVHSKE